MSVVTNHQYEPPKLPPEWTGDEKKFYTRLIDILDEIYSKYGRLSLTDLSPAVRKVISGMVDGTTFETAIEQLQDSIALKASQSTVDELGNRVTNAETSLTLKADQATLTSTAAGLQSQIDAVPSAITLAVGNVDVGGRNQLRGTQDFSGAVLTNAARDGEIHNCQAVHYNFTNSGSPSYSDSVRFNGINFDGGETYMISFWAKGSGTFVLQTATASMVGTRTSSQGVSGSGNFGEITISVPTDWTRIWVKWQINSGTWTDKSILFRQITNASNLYVAGVKLEKGNKATDWTPAPEDASVPLSGMDNLYSTGDSVSGYLTSGGGIAGGGTSLTETTSDYIAVTPGETLTFQCWVTPEMGSTNYLWMAYGFFDSSKAWMSSPGRTAQTQGANTGTAQHKHLTFTVPAGAAYIRISGRMYADGRMKLEQNAEPTPYRDATAEIVNTSMTINRKGFFVNTSGIVGINAVDSNNESYIYLGDILELDDQGGLKAKVGNFTQSLKVGGKQVAALPYPVIFSRTTPTQTGVIWIQPTAAISAQFSSPSDSSRNSRLHFGYYGSTSASLPAFTFSAVGTDTVSGTGNKTYRLEFDIYSLTDLSSVTASFSATATKSGSTVNFGASSTYTLKKYQLEHITLTATSTTNLCSNTSAITVTIKATGSNLNKIFVQSNQTMLLNCAAAASSGQQACNLIFIP